MTLLARDEADIVGANLDYHFAQGVDFVIATDHSSRDGTTELLRAYERDGVLLLREVGGEAHDQVAHVNAMARTAAVDHGADWVINNDADEFWWPLIGSLRDVLSGVPDEFGALEAPRFNFRPRVGGPEAFLERMVVRETASMNGVGDPLEPKVIHRGTPDIAMGPGNHSIDFPDVAVAPDIGLLEVLHFPMRAFEQFERKVLNVGIGYERLESRQPEVGRDQLALLQLQREGRLRAHFDDAVVDDSGLDAELAGGRLVIDTRLRDYMAALGSVGAGGDQAPDAAGARKVVSRALAIAAELDGVRAEIERRSEELARAAAERDAAREDLARLNEELGAAVAGHGRAERQLASTDAALRALQTSRLIRYSQPLRRLYYRLRAKRRRSLS